jgi:hypothetical protein
VVCAFQGDEIAESHVLDAGGNAWDVHLKVDVEMIRGHTDTRSGGLGWQHSNDGHARAP